MTSVCVIRSHSFGKIVNKRRFVHRIGSWILSEKQEVNHTLFAVHLVVFTAVPDWSFHRGRGALQYKPIRDVLFFRVSFFSVIPERGMKIDQKFRNGLLLCS